MKRCLRNTVIAAASVLIGIAGSAQAADVTVGFQLVYGPWKAKMEELKANGLGGKSIEFVKFTSGTEVINAMASGSVDISLNGSSPTAAGYSRGVDLQVIYIYDNINNAEALVVDDSVTAPQDLKGKTIAVPFGSTTHFHMMFALEQFNIPPRGPEGDRHVAAGHGRGVGARRHQRRVRLGPGPRAHEGEGARAPHLRRPQQLGQGHLRCDGRAPRGSRTRTPSSPASG